MAPDRRYRLENSSNSLLGILLSNKLFAISFSISVILISMGVSNVNIDVISNDSLIYYDDNHTYFDTINVRMDSAYIIGSFILNLVEGNSDRPITNFSAISEEPPDAYEAPPPPLVTLTNYEVDAAKMNYIERFASVAIAEMEKYNIPASITLAQGLLESNAGRSTLSSRYNNHFGIKCHSRTCDRGHCVNYEDDHPHDRFVVFRNAWSSYRAHSMVLLKPRYSRLFNLDIHDYKGWAREIKACGYATDPRYPEKLIRIIENYQLYKYDQ